MTTTERRHRLHSQRDTSATYEQLALMEKDDMTMRNLFKSTFKSNNNPNVKGNRIAAGLIIGSLIGLALMSDPANAAAMSITKNKSSVVQAGKSYCEAGKLIGKEGYEQASDLYQQSMVANMLTGGYTAADTTQLINMVNGLMIGMYLTTGDNSGVNCERIGRVAADMLLIER